MLAFETHMVSSSFMEVNALPSDLLVNVIVSLHPTGFKSYHWEETQTKLLVISNGQFVEQLGDFLLHFCPGLEVPLLDLHMVHLDLGNTGIEAHPL